MQLNARHGNKSFQACNYEDAEDYVGRGVVILIATG